MAAETIDYTAVLADLKAKRSALDAAIAGIEASQGLGDGELPPIIPSGDQSLIRKPAEREITEHSFFSLTIPEAIKKCFAIVKRPMAVNEITTALQQGGLITNASNLPATVSGTLGRMKRSGELVALGKGKWGPSDWFKGKKTLEAQAPKKRKAHKVRKVKPPTAKATDAPKHASNEQIARIRELHASGKTYGEIAKEVGLHHFVVMRILKTAA